MNSAVRPQSKTTLISHGEVPVAFSTSTKSIRFSRTRNFNLSRASSATCKELRFDVRCSHEDPSSGLVRLTTAGLSSRFMLDHTMNSMVICG